MHEETLQNEATNLAEKSDNEMTKKDHRNNSKSSFNLMVIKVVLYYLRFKVLR